MAMLPGADAKAILSALALHRFVRQPLEFQRKWMTKGHLTLRHHYACHIHFWRNPPLRARYSAPKKLTSLVLIVERGRLHDQLVPEPEALPTSSPRVWKRIHMP